MSPELQKAIEERKSLGYSDEKIRQELVDAGYDDGLISQILDSSEVVPPVPQAVDKADFPRATTLINGAINFLKERYDLALVLAIPFLSISLLDYLLESGVLPESMLIVSGFLALVAFVAYYFLSLAVLYITINDSDREVHFKEATDWAKKHFFKFIWLSFISGLVIFGGFMLLIIPGIILSIYLYLAQYVFVNEGKTGFSAMSRSHQLVTGNLGSLFATLLVIGIIVLLVFMVVFGLISLATVSVAENQVAIFLMDVIAQVSSVFLTVAGFFVGNQIYRHLLHNPQAEGETKSRSTMYGIFAAVAVLIVPAIIFLAVMFGEDFEEAVTSDTTGLYSEESIQRDTEAKNRAQELRVLEEGG